MQLRISQGPTSALGIGEIVTAEEVRAAFLQLTKQFHPARFGRMSPDLQRMANEVFLGIKSAHDHMLKALGSAPRGGARPPTGAVPLVNADPRASQSMPRIVGTSPPASTLARGTDGGTGRASSPAIPAGRTLTPAGGTPATRPTTGSMPRLSTPAGAAPAASTTPVPPGTQPGVGAPVRGGAASPSTPPSTAPAPRGFTPVPPGTQPGVTPAPSASTSQRMARIDAINPPTQPPVRAPVNPPTTPPVNPPTNPPTGRGPVLPPRPSPDGFNPPTVRNVAGTSPSGSQPMPRFGSPPPGAEPFDETAAFRDAAALMERKDWTAARQALHALAARVPQSKSYRAWLCYARGREAYLAGRPDDAILEMQRALQLEPDLAHAKHALAELQRRR